MRLLIILLLFSFAGMADDAPDELTKFHALKDEAGKAYSNENWQVAFDKANEALIMRPLHPSINALIIRSAEKLGKEDAVEAAKNRLDAQGLNFIRPLKNTPPVGQARIFFQATQLHHLPESLAVRNDQILIGYVADRLISNGTDSVPITSFGSPLGMTPALQDDHLWVSTAVLPQSYMGETLVKMPSGLIKLNMATETVIESYHPEGKGQSFGSVSVAKSGSVYTSDSNSASLYRVKGTGLVKIAGHGGKGSFQGIAPIGDSVYVADYSNGIYAFNEKTGKEGYVVNKSAYSLITIDGLAAYGDNQLIAIQNGLWPHRVLRLVLEEGAIVCAEVLAADLPEFDEPTNGSVKGDEFIFIANSQWPKYSDPNLKPKNGDVDRALLLSIDLKTAGGVCLKN